MTNHQYIDDIVDRLSPANRPEGFPALLVALLRELGRGDPVSKEALATKLGRPLARVAAVLDQVPSAEYDEEGRIIGYGVTLRETPHAFQMNGKRLYTWCALDTLMFPALMAETASVSSTCPQTGRPVALTVTPKAIHNVEPEGATVSLMRPAALEDIRKSFCCHVHYFASRAGRASSTGPTAHTPSTTKLNATRYAAW